MKRNMFCEKLLSYIAAQTRSLLRYTNYSCVNHFLQKMGFAETRTQCSIKPITDKKTVLFGVSDRLLEEVIQNNWGSFRFRIDLTLLILLMFRFFL